MRRGIRFRLGVLLAAFGVLATGLTGWYSYTESRTLLVRAAERELASTTQVFARKLAAAVDTAQDDARVLAALEWTRVMSAPGHPRAVAARSALADAFHAVLRAHPEYLDVSLAAADAAPAALLQVDSGREAKGREPGAQAPTLAVTSAVPPGDGVSAGYVVVIDVDLSRIFRSLKSDLPAHLRLLLADDQGNFLAAFGDGSAHSRLQEAFDDVRPLFAGSRAELPVVARTAPGGARAGEPALAAFVRLPLAAGSDRRHVVLGIAQPVSTIVASTRELGRNTVRIVLLCSAIAVGLALVAARLVTRPLQQITREVRRFSTEQAMGELPTARRDEIGELARGIDEMRERIGSALAELDASRNRMAHLARHDALTGLPNRTVFLDRLEHAIVAAHRNGTALAVLFVDIDRFKPVNDTHGHAIGDQVLVQSATLLRSAVRQADTVARWGGDEFVILLEGMDEEHDARRVAQALLDSFSHPMQVGGLALDLGASIGISMYPRDAFEANELIQRADEAMYLSKHRAGNRYSVFGNQIDSEA